VLLLVLVATLLVGTLRLTRGHSTPLSIPLLLGVAVLFAAYRRTGDLRLLAHGTPALSAAGAAGASWLAGGIGAPALYTLAFVPLLATFVGGRRAGLAWAAVCVAIVVSFEAVAVVAPELAPRRDPSRNLPGFAVFMMVLAGAVIGWVYEAAREASERRVQRREEAIRNLLWAMPDALLRLGPDGRCVQVHAGGAAELLGSEPVGSRVSEIFPSAHDLDASLEQALSSGAEVEHELVIDERRVLLRFAPYRDGARVLVRDVTDARRMESRLANAELLANLERADRMSSIGLLAAGMAHEINNPLAFLAGNLAFLQQELEKDVSDRPERVEALADTRVAADRIRRIVNDLEQYVRQDDTEPETLTLEAVVDSAVKLAQNQIQHRARLVVDHEPAAPVTGVESRLVQVVLNVLVNAAHAVGQEPGAHEIRVRTFEDADGHPSIEVSDTGPGVDPEILPKLTQPFFTTKPPGVGTGLGLAVCEGIVRRSGGTLRIENRPEGGARVSVRLPPARQARPASRRPTRREAPTDQPARVLVIDDEPLVRRALRRLLRRHEVVEAESGAAALEILGSERSFDVILCDVMMPELNGIDVYREVHARWPAVAQRLVFMTGGAFDARVQELFSSLVQEPVVLDKPFDPAQLERVIGERVRSARE